MRFEVLTPAEMDLAHKKSLQILTKAGVRVESPKILKMMAAAGCEVSLDQSIIKFPADIIEACLKLAPEKFILGSLHGKHDMFLGEGASYVTTDGQGCFAADLDTDERRDSTMKDLTDAARLADALDYIQCFWPIVTAGDVPAGSRCLHEIVECWKVSSKHITADCFNETQAEYYEKILIEILGSREEIAKRNILSLCCCPVTPLVFEGPMLEGTVKLGEVGTPVLVLPMPISGTTSPMSLFSTIIQNNAEVLAGNAILQTAHPGRPVIYGSAAGILDMSTSLFSVGSSEGALQNAACAQMARRYKMPNLISAGGADAQTPGIQSAAERMTAMLLGFLTGSDLICGVGLTATAQCLYREELIIAEDMAGYCKRVANGVRSSEDDALTDLAIEIGPGGNFLAEESTVEYLYNGEYFMPKVFSREGYEIWRDSPKRDIIQFAKNKVRDILNRPAIDNFNARLSEKLRLILADADTELAG